MSLRHPVDNIACSVEDEAWLRFSKVSSPVIFCGTFSRKLTFEKIVSCCCVCSNSPNRQHPMFTFPHASPTLPAVNVPYSHSHMHYELLLAHIIPYSHVHMHFPRSQQPISHIHIPICIMSCPK